ncbi:hypothetical protein [Roseovarius aestuarii]|uniref:hypothetical protein n=1 Tax=Roseovarius aestuarii TaxID=475083 RepID=UPI000A26E15E|nr:hypothetical protein [Roseovarius aestuarii]
MINTYAYTLKTIIQAGRKRIPMTSVPVRVNVVVRSSRVFRGMGEYVRRSIATILRVFLIYAPLRFFSPSRLFLRCPRSPLSVGFCSSISLTAARLPCRDE